MSTEGVDTERVKQQTTTDEVLAQVTTMIGRVIDDEALMAVAEVTMETSFEHDLELESIEFVALSEELMNHYGDDVDLMNWIADLEIDEIIEMKVGTLVDFIVGQLDG